jgi:hypothetical protein
MTEKPRKPHDPTDMTHPLYDPARDPLSPFYKRDEADSESDPSADDTYKVGPGFPPKPYTWKKGCPTPNPKGRPRKVPTMRPDLKKALESALNEKVVITKEKKKTVLTKATLGIQQLVNQFAKGDRYARRDLFQYASRLGVELPAKHIIAEALGIDEEAILDAALRRRAQQATPEGSPDDHVKAPPELLDDDVVKTDTNEAADAAPRQDTKKPPEPVLDENGKPLPVNDIRYVRAMRERNLANEKKNREES